MNKLIIALLVLLSALSVSCKEAEKQPNIVVILCDDLGYGDLSCFGHPVIQTPNLDKMAEDGIKFTNCYSAAPVCSPSRAGLLTGRSPNRAGIYDFIPSPKFSEDCRDMVHLQAHEQTIPQMLKKVGYSTILSGKWHCSSRFNSDEQPKPGHFGFDHWFATHNNAAPSHLNPKNFVRNGEDVGEIEGSSCQIVVDEAVNWLNKKADDSPFYMQLCFHEPHEPVASPEYLIEKYIGKAKNEAEAQYFANVANVDHAVGRIMAYLKEHGHDNTLVFFTADNGPETLMRYNRAKHSYGSPGKLKGMKLWTHEAGFRVPGILYWIGKETFKGTSDAVVSSLDFMPTFAKLAGASLPDRALDGESFLSLIETGEKDREKPLTWAFYNALNEHVVAMRTSNWKIMCKLQSESNDLPKIKNLYTGNEDLVKNADLTDFVLYNMKTDMGETKNVAAEHPEVFDEMKALLAKEYSTLLDGSHIWNRENN